MRATVAELRRAGITLRYLDFGGGLGVRYAHEQPPSMRAYARALTAIPRPLRCHLLLEPGRAIVASAGVLLTRVLYTKRNRGKTFVVVDAAMNDFMRPALYDAVHPMTPVHLSDRSADERTARVDVVGPVCETGDCFLHDWPLGEVSLEICWCCGALALTVSSRLRTIIRALVLRKCWSTARV